MLIHVNNEELQNLKSLVDKEMYEKKKKTKATPISLDSPHLKPILWGRRFLVCVSRCKDDEALSASSASRPSHSGGSRSSEEASWEDLDTMTTPSSQPRPSPISLDGRKDCEDCEDCTESPPQPLQTGLPPTPKPVEKKSYLIRSSGGSGSGSGSGGVSSGRTRFVAGKGRIGARRISSSGSDRSLIGTSESTSPVPKESDEARRPSSAEYPSTHKRKTEDEEESGYQKEKDDVIERPVHRIESAPRSVWVNPKVHSVPSDNVIGSGADDGDDWFDFDEPSSAGPPLHAHPQRGGRGGSDVRGKSYFPKCASESSIASPNDEHGAGTRAKSGMESLSSADYFGETEDAGDQGDNPRDGEMKDLGAIVMEGGRKVTAALTTWFGQVKAQYRAQSGGR